ncbi:MAG: hypothetical protein ACM3S0_12185 [Acidobacteriota bacterium]
MQKQDWKLSELMSLSQASAFLRSRGRPRHVQSLRERIRSGMLRGTRIGRNWFLLKKDVEFLASLPYHPQGGRPATKNIRGRGGWVDLTEIQFIAQTPLPKRAQAMYAAQTLLLSTTRARVRRVWPKLVGVELARKVFEELEKP